MAVQSSAVQTPLPHKRAITYGFVTLIAAALFSVSFGTETTVTPPLAPVPHGSGGVRPQHQQPTSAPHHVDSSSGSVVSTFVKQKTPVVFETTSAIVTTTSPARTLEESTMYGTLLALASSALQSRSGDDKVHCPSNYWMPSPLEEQARVAPLFTLSPKYKSTRSKTFKPKKRAVVIFVGQFEEPSSSRVRKRATTWAANFDKAYLVGADSPPVKHMACNRNSFPHLVTCAAHIMLTEGGNFASVTILDATSKDYDNVACTLANRFTAFEANMPSGDFNEKQPLLGRIIIDTEPLEALTPSDHCARNRFVSHLFAHATTSAVAKRWPMLSIPKDAEALLQLHWYTHRHRLKALVIPSAAFHSFFKMASEWLLTDTPADIGIIPFVELLAIAVGDGDGESTPLVTLHRLRSSMGIGEAKDASARSKTTFESLAAVPPPLKSLYGAPLLTAVDGTCKSTSVANIDPMEPSGTNKHFAMFTKLPIGSWIIPYNVRKGAAAVPDATVHGDLSPSGNAGNDEPRGNEDASDPSSTFLTVSKRTPSRFSVRLKVKGVGPVSPASPQVPRTWDFLDHDQPDEWSRVNFYPPVIVVSMKHNEILDRDFIRNYFKTLEKHFRRVVIVSRDPAKGFNDMHAPFPRYCLDGLSTTACMIHLLRKRLIRRSGGLMFLHIDAFIFPLEHFGDGRIRDMLVSKRHQYFGGAPDDWPLWPEVYKTDFAGTAGEPHFAHWNRGLQVFGSYFHEWREQNTMLRSAQEMRQNTFSDIFYIPSRAFDMAVDILDYHFPSMTPFEGFVGYWASVIASATTTRYNGFEYQGCCCCGSDGEVMTHPAGHKVTPSNQQTVNNMARRIADSFSCDVSSDLIAVTSPQTSLGPVQHIFNSATARGVFERSADVVYTALEEQTCRVEVRLQLASKAPTVNVLFVAPLSNVVQLKVECGAGAHKRVTLLLHTPNVNTARVEFGPSCLASDGIVRFAVVTGVTHPTKVMVNENRDAGFKLDEGDDIVIVEATAPSKLQVDVDTSSHFKSDVAVSAAGGVEASVKVSKG